MANFIGIDLYGQQTIDVQDTAARLELPNKADKDLYNVDPADVFSKIPVDTTVDSSATNSKLPTTKAAYDAITTMSASIDLTNVDATDFYDKIPREEVILSTTAVNTTFPTTKAVYDVTRDIAGDVQRLDLYKADIDLANVDESDIWYKVPKTTIIDINSTDTEVATAKSIYQNLAGKAANDLSNVSKDDFYKRFTESAASHNSIYRGKYLGDHLSNDQKVVISMGLFTDMYIGDYWTINGTNYRIAAFDYYIDTGDTACTTHHVTLVPDSIMYNAMMNTANDTTGAYVGSQMYTTNLATAKTTIENDFGATNILTHRQLLKNAVTNGYETASAWYDSTVELMTEQNMYGGLIFSNSVHGTNSATQNTIDKTQYPLFAFDPTKINIRANYWLRDVANASSFCFVSAGGVALAYNASASYGVRPAFSII